MNKRNMAVIAAAIALAGGFGVAETMKGMDHESMDHSGMEMMDHAEAVPPELAEDPAVQAYVAAMAVMMRDMAIPYTGDADVDFVKGMIPHHEAAVAMAKVQLEFGRDPEIRALSKAIIAAQETEIAAMKTWLAARGQ